MLVKNSQELLSLLILQGPNTYVKEKDLELSGNTGAGAEFYADYLKC